MSQPTSVVLIAKRDHSIFLARNERDGLWILPVVHGWDGLEPTLTQLTKSYFYPYIEDVRIGEFRLLASPKDRVDLGGVCAHCAIFSVIVRGKFRSEVEGRYWLANKEMLVPQAITRDVMCIIGLTEVQSCLQ
jgi:hypothetical protein